MSFNNKTIAIACSGLILSASAAFAQVGGSDVPTDAKAKGTMENGSSSTGMSKGHAMHHMMKKKKKMHKAM